MTAVVVGVVVVVVDVLVYPHSTMRNQSLARIPRVKELGPELLVVMVMVMW